MLIVNDFVVVEQRRLLEQMLTTDPKTRGKIQRLVKKAVKEARDRVVSRVPLRRDPRGARNAVRRSVYRQILGGNVNIFSSRKAGGASSYEAPRKLRTGQRGGNRRKRSAATIRMERYGGKDRGMVLRWMNDGTNERKITFTPNVRRTHANANTGRRGSITGGHWFRRNAEKELQEAANLLAEMIDKEIGG